MSTTAETTAHVEGVADGLKVRDLPAPGVQSHAANLMTLPGGELGCVWFGGTQEGLSDISVWFSRLTPGTEAWSAPRQLSHDAQRSEQNPILFQAPAPDGRLWLLHTAQHAGHQDTSRVRVRQSTDGGATWGPTQDLLDGSGLFVRQPPLVRGDGAWLLPIFRCRTLPGERWSGDHDDSAVLVSYDQGRQWHEHPVPASLGCVHMNLVPASTDVAGQGRHLLAFYRSRWADAIWRSTSDDGGLNWTAPQPTVLPNNNSSIQVVRLASGRLAMVFNDISAAQATERRVSLYDEIDGGEGAAPLAAVPAPAAPTAPATAAAAAQATPEAATPPVRRAFWGTPRAPMSIALSEDDGLTWPWKRVIEAGDGYCMTNDSARQRNRELSYPSVHQSADGALHVAYTRHRQHIRHVQLTEDWVRQAPGATA